MARTPYINAAKQFIKIITHKLIEFTSTKNYEMRKYSPVYGKSDDANVDNGTGHQGPDHSVSSTPQALVDQSYAYVENQYTH